MKKALAMLLAAVMLLSLAACGDGAKKAADPEHITLGDFELGYKDAYITQDSRGKDALVVKLSFTNNSADAASFLLNIAVKALQNSLVIGSAAVYTDADTMELVSNSQLAELDPGETAEVCAAFALCDLKNSVEVRLRTITGDEELSFTIELDAISREQAAAQNVPTASEPEASAESAADVPATVNDPAPCDDELLNWWNGGWYGWWHITAASGDYEPYDDYWWNACAFIDIGADYTGTIEIWDQDAPRAESTTGYVQISLNSAGTSEHGTVMSEDGWFLEQNLEHADWIVDPGIAKYADMFWTTGCMETDSGSLDYEIYLRPWGMRWNDVAEDDIPTFYSDWYLPLIESGASMPDSMEH